MDKTVGQLYIAVDIICTLNLRPVIGSRVYRIVLYSFWDILVDHAGK
jgi:hypothetical protein